MPSTSLPPLERIAAALETIAAASEPASRAEVKAAFHALAEAKGPEYCTALLRLWGVERYVEVKETGLFVAALNAARLASTQVVADYDLPRLYPVTFKEAKAFIAEHHRHNRPPAGWKFGVGLKVGDRLVGVATAGRPVARHYDDGLTLEVNRTCTDGTKNANSQLYGAVWRAAKALGYLRCITYTQAGETGASLRAAGWARLKELPPRKSWAESSVKLRDVRDPIGTGGVARVLWEIRSIPPTSISSDEVP